jgi:hypothetical protein
MTKEELDIESNKFITLCEKYPKKQGSRTDLRNQDKYDRQKLIMDEFKNIWPHSVTYISHRIDKIYYYLKNDNEIGFFRKKLFDHKWKPVSLINFVKKGLADIDNKDVLMEIYNDRNISARQATNKVNKCVKLIPTAYVYILKYWSNNKLLPSSNVKKIGWSENIVHRLKKLNTATPYNVTPLLYAKVVGLRSDELESLLHRKFSEYQIKLEWFVDPYDTLVNETIEFINTLEDYTVEFMYNEDEFFKKYTRYHTIGKDNIKVFDKPKTIKIKEDRVITEKDLEIVDPVMTFWLNQVA